MAINEQTKDQIPDILKIFKNQIEPKLFTRYIAKDLFKKIHSKKKEDSKAGYNALTLFEQANVLDKNDVFFKEYSKQS